MVFHSDCLSLVQRLNSSACDRSLVGTIVTEIKAKCVALASVSFKHVHRHCNVVAHVLAKSSLNSLSPCIFLSALDCIRETLRNLVA